MRQSILRSLAMLCVVAILGAAPVFAGETPAVGETFPEFTGKTHDGKTVSLSDYKGKVVLVDFWATWCGPCVRELPNVHAAYEKYHDKGFEIVGISLDNANGKLEAWYADAKKTLPWPSIFDGKGWSNELAQRFGIQSIPAAFLLDKSGKVVATGVRGGRLHKAIEATLEGKSLPADMRVLFMEWHQADDANRAGAEARLVAAGKDADQEELNEMAWFYLTEGKPNEKGAALMLSLLGPTIEAGTNGGAIDTAAFAAYLSGDPKRALELQEVAVAALKKETGATDEALHANPAFAELMVRMALYAAASGRTEMAEEHFRMLEKNFPAGSPFREHPHFALLMETLGRKGS